MNRIGRPRDTLPGVCAIDVPEMGSANKIRSVFFV